MTNFYLHAIYELHI